MSGSLLRPTFEIVVTDTPPRVAARLGEALSARSESFEARWARGERHAIVAPVRAHRKPWSPWLHLDVRAPEEEGNEGTVVFGRFTPNPGLWTGYMLSLIALLAIALFAMALALSQMTLERTQWGWWILIGALVAAGALIAGSRIAQRLASEQMGELHEAIERAVGSERPSE